MLLFVRELLEESLKGESLCVCSKEFFQDVCCALYTVLSFCLLFSAFEIAVLLL